MSVVTERRPGVFFEGIRVYVEQRQLASVCCAAYLCGSLKESS